jgi:hypothetical protein
LKRKKNKKWKYFHILYYKDDNITYHNCNFSYSNK